MSDTREYMECRTCNGLGGPDPVWDDDTVTWHHFTCGSCGGRGYNYRWVEDA